MSSSSLAALSAALNGSSSKKAHKQHSKTKKNKGKGKMAAKGSGKPDFVSIIAETVKTVDGHTSAMDGMAKKMEEMEQTVQSLKQVVVQLGKRSLEAGDQQQKKKRKVPDHIVNYYLVATEFFNHFSQLTGVPQKKALGKSGIDAWGTNKDALIGWFKENGLDLETNKLKISDIRDIIGEHDLFDKFKTDFNDLCTSIENAQAPVEQDEPAEEEEDLDSQDDDSDGEDDNSDSDNDSD